MRVTENFARLKKETRERRLIDCGAEGLAMEFHWDQRTQMRFGNDRVAWTVCTVQIPLPWLVDKDGHHVMIETGVMDNPKQGACET